MTELMEVTFPKLNHFWLDSGLLGLTILLKEVDSDIKKTVDEEGLKLEGTAEAIQDTLERAYSLLIKRYYNLSTKKQKEDNQGFYYDSKDKIIKRFPKKQLAGIPSLLYGENQIFQYEKAIKWKDKTHYRLPDEYAEIQKILDEFVNTVGLKPTTTVLLLDAPYKLIPKMESMYIVETKEKVKCFLCGRERNGKKKEITKGTYPFITSSSGFKTFNSLLSSAESICWQCDYVSKFIPINSFYHTIKDKKREDIFAFFPYSISLEKMIEVYTPLQDAKYDDPNLFKNFQHPLGFEKSDGFFQKPFEVTFAFLYTLYRKVLHHQKSDEDEGVLNWEEMCDFTFSKAPLEFVFLHAESKGNTSMGKMVWPFRDSVYFFRLMENLEKDGINIKEIMRLLIDFSIQKNENKTFIRNRICERILKKNSVLDLIESHVFNADNTYIKPLFDFIVNYEPIVRKESGIMTTEEQEAATTLGKRIGMIVGKEGKKGDLFALRKARRKTDFLNEINRLQFKCRLTVPPDVYEGKLTDSNFLEFKQFCMIAALNSFYAATQPEKGGKS